MGCVSPGVSRLLSTLLVVTACATRAAGPRNATDVPAASAPGPDAEPLTERVAAQWQAGHIDDAVALLEAAHAGAQDDRFVDELACAWVERAVAGGESFDAARERLRMLLGEDTRRMDVYAQLALSYVREPGPGRAGRLYLARHVIASARGMLEAPPSAPLEHAAGVVAYARGDVAGARAAFARAVAIDPASAEANLGVAIVARGLREHATAAAAFQQGIGHAPHRRDVEANVLWAHSLAESGDPLSARALLRAEARRNDDARLWYALGRIDADYVQPLCWQSECPDRLRPGMSAVESFRRAVTSANASQYPDLVAAAERGVDLLRVPEGPDPRELEEEAARLQKESRANELIEKARLQQLEQEWLQLQAQGQ